MSKIKFTIFISLFFIYRAGLVQAQSVIDSLENYAQKAKHGWDQIDNAIGLGELYVDVRFFEKAADQVQQINTWAETYGIPEGKAYALVIEGMVADESVDNADTALIRYQKAEQIARDTHNKDALAYAVTEQATILIWNIGDTENGVRILRELLDEIDDTVSRKNIAAIYTCLGYAMAIEGDQKQAFSYYTKALTSVEDLIENPPVDEKIGRVSSQMVLLLKQKAAILNGIANLYQNMGDLENAMALKINAMEVTQQTEIAIDIAWMNVNMSKLFSAIGDYPKSLDYMSKARRIYEAPDLRSDIAWVDGETTLLFLKLKDYPSAEVYSLKNLKYLREANPNSHHYGGSLLWMVTIQIGKRDFEAASNYLIEAEKAIKRTDQSVNTLRLRRLQGVLALENSAYIEAVRLFKHAAQMSADKGLEQEYAHNQYHLAETYYHQSNYDSSFFYAQKALKKMKILKNIDLLTQCYLLLSKIFEAKKDFESAFKNHQAFFAFNDSLYTEGAVEKLKSEQVRQSVLTFKDEKELAEQSLILLARENKIYVGVGVLIFIILLFMAFLYTKLMKVKAKTQSQNMQLTKLNQTKDKFFGIIAHDLRSPLIGLQGVGEQVDYFLRKGKTDQLRKVSKTISDTTKRLNELLDNLLNWALLQNGMIPYHPEAINLKSTVEAIIAMFGPLADLKQVQLENCIQSDVAVYADEKALNTVLRNLISNALKYTEPNGTVAISSQENSERIMVMISDSGTGISADQFSKLFDLQKESKQGTIGEQGSGLGLVLCKELVELNQGKIKVESELGRGSVFTFDLPKSI